jgi:hypothetical protein
MTPLARAFVKEMLTSGPDDSPFPELILSSDCRCFETTAIMPLVSQLIRNFEWKVRDDVHVFLPAQHTWIEWKTSNGRNGVLLSKFTNFMTINARKPFDDSLIDSPDLMKPPGSWSEQNGETRTFTLDGGIIAKQGCANYDEHVMLIGANPLVLGKAINGHFVVSELAPDNQQTVPFAELFADSRTFAALLAIINTPKVVAHKKNHPMHAGLRRKIAHATGRVGKAKFQDWTEIVLQVSARLNAHGEPDDVGAMQTLSGARALHLCRAHLRIRLGKLELVRQHWRGDPAAGISQSYYTVKP